MKKSRRSGCPINFTLEALGDKWSLLIVRDLFRGKRHYGELLESPEGIATNILSDRLASLERAGILFKQADPDHGSKIVYGLTAKGLALSPVLMEIRLWGARHDPRTAFPPALLRKIKRDKRAAVHDEVAGYHRSRMPDA
jgi:DNA-binding HxlR family transcriptional regulator